MQIFVRPKIFLGTKIFSDPNFNEIDLLRDKTELLNSRLSKLPSTKDLLKLEFDTKDQVLLFFVIVNDSISLDAVVEMDTFLKLNLTPNSREICKKMIKLDY